MGGRVPPPGRYDMMKKRLLMIIALALAVCLLPGCALIDQYVQASAGAEESGSASSSAPDDETGTPVPEAEIHALSQVTRTHEPMDGEKSLAYRQTLFFDDGYILLLELPQGGDAPAEVTSFEALQARDGDFALIEKAVSQSGFLELPEQLETEAEEGDRVCILAAGDGVSHECGGRMADEYGPEAFLAVNGALDDALRRGLPVLEQRTDGRIVANSTLPYIRLTKWNGNGEDAVLPVYDYTVYENGIYVVDVYERFGELRANYPRRQAELIRSEVLYCGREAYGELLAATQKTAFPEPAEEEPEHKDEDEAEAGACITVFDGSRSQVIESSASEDGEETEAFDNLYGVFPIYS